MSEQALLTMGGNGHDEVADAEEFLQGASLDAMELPEEYRRWFPTEYVVAILGHRRSGKSALMAVYLLKALVRGVPVYTNLELYPEKLSYCPKDVQKALKLDDLLSFDPRINTAAVGIEEIGTWVEAMRAQSTTNILLSKFFQLFIGKQSLRIFFTNQSTHLPFWIWEQVDLHIQAHDMFYTEWGRENNLAKGTSFYYVATDKSGVFTGQPGNTWGFGLRKANQVWTKYNSYQMFDPHQWARRTRVVGEEMVYDLKERRLFTEGEHSMEMEQEQLRRYNTLLQGEYRAWGDDLIAWAKQSKAIIHDEDNGWTLSLGRLQTSMADTKGKARKAAERLLNKVQALANNSQGYLAEIDRGRDIIYLVKPIPEAGEAQP